MSATVSAATTAFIASKSYGMLFSWGGAMTIMLLILLLVQKAIYRTLGDSYSIKIRILDTVIGPLLLVLGFASIVRLLSIL